MNYTYEQIEDALIAYLKEQIPYARTVATNEDQIVAQSIQDKTLQTPALLLEMTRTDYIEESEYADLLGLRKRKKPRSTTTASKRKSGKPRS